MMRGEWGVTGGKIYSTVLLPPLPLWPARMFINNNNLPSIHVIRKQTRTKDNQQSQKKTSHFIEIYFKLILIIKLAQRSNILSKMQR